MSYLNKKNINFIQEHTFADCKNKKLLRFDFFIPDKNICIEYDGKQHYEEVNWYGQNLFEGIQKRDKIKSEYCKKNNIHLIRIKYSDKIKDILTNCGV